jgi:ABC-2 type transport system permease protein
MRFKKIWTITLKDFLIFRNKRSILFSLVGLLAFISIGLPMLIEYFIRKSGSSLSPLLLTLIDAFSFWFVIIAAIIPTSIASYSIVGEKVEKSLEPLLAAPVTDEEILMGKSLAAFIPSIISIWAGGIIFMFLINLFSYKALTYLYYPNWYIAVILLILGPLACILSIGFNIIVSSRINDVRSAQQLGMLIVLPFGIIYVLKELSIIYLSVNNLLIISAIVLIIDIFVFYLVMTTFRREEILTKWQ